MTRDPGAATDRMYASVVSESRRPDGLRHSRIPVPRPGPGEVLIRVTAASLDRVDTYLRYGTHGMTVTEPTVLGRDLAGTVARIGSGVSGLAIGDRVLALGRGAHAEFAVAPARHTLPRPAHWSDAQAAALPTAGRTAFDAVHTLAGVGPGDTVLVIAAAGAVGTFAVQYAKALGARVIGTAGTAAKRSAVVGLGAEAAFDHYADTLVDELLEHTGGSGVDVVIESAGGELWSSLQFALAPRARMITCGVTAGARANIHLGKLMVNGWTLRGIGRPGPAEVADQLRAALALSAGLDDPPVIDRIFPLAEAAAAHAYLEASDFVGRVILTP